MCDVSVSADVNACDTAKSNNIVGGILGAGKTDKSCDSAENR